MTGPGMLPAIDHALIILSTLVIKASLIICLCWACTFFLKQYSASLRHLMWVLTLAGVLLLPALNLALPGWQILKFQLSPTVSAAEPPSPIINPKVKRLTPATTPAPSAFSADMASSKAPVPPHLTEAGSPPGSFNVTNIVLCIWGLGVLFMLVRLLISHMGLKHMTRRMMQLETGEIASNIEHIRKELSIQRPIALYIGLDANTPMTWGLLKPIIALPTDALTWRPDHLYSVLYHELSHIRRCDYLWNLICQLACAVYWFNPLVWLAYHFVHFEQEKASDEQVLRSGVRSETYAEHLLFVARSQHHLRRRWDYTPMGSVAMAHAHALQKRVHAILFGKLSQRMVSKGHLWTLSVLACSITSLMAVIQPGFTEDSASYIWLEAEQGHLSGTLDIAEDAEASQGYYIWARENNREGAGKNADKASFRFEVSQPGQYIIWGRVQAHSGSSNSFYVSVDDSASSIWDVYGPDSDYRAHRWTWDRVRSRTQPKEDIDAPVSFNTYTLQPGWHTLSIIAREKGTRIDHILITNDKAYRPRGVGKAPDEAEPSYVWLEAEDGTWRNPLYAVEDPSASNGAYVWAPEAQAASQPTDEGDVQFQFEIDQTDDYVMWGRVIAPSANTNSFFISVDSAPFEIWDMDAPKKRASSLPWNWERVAVRASGATSKGSPKTYRLNKGQHTLALKAREFGTRIDRLLITNDKTYKPEGWGTSPGELIPTYLWVEAEDGILMPPLSVETDTTASGERYIAASNPYNSRMQPPGDGRAAYHLDIPLAGTYLMWSRVRASNNEEDSFWVRMDNGPWIRWNGITHGDAWHWEEIHDSGQKKAGVVSFELKPGRHMLEIAYREPSSRLDGFLITNDLNFAPASYSDDPIVLKRENLISAARSTR